MQGVSIRSQPTLLGLRRTAGGFQISSGGGVFVLRTSYPRVEIHREGPRLELDQQRVREEMGLKGPLKAGLEARDQAAALTQEAIATIAAEGDRLAAIENPRNTIEELAWDKAILSTEREFNVAAMPRSRPKARVEGNLQISWKLGEIEVEIVPRTLQIVYRPWQVQAYLRQKGFVQIGVRESGSVMFAAEG